MSFGIVEPGKLLGVAAGPVKRWLRREEPPGERVLWIRLLSEGSRWSVSGGALSGLLIFGRNDLLRIHNDETLGNEGAEVLDADMAEGYVSLWVG